jgi:3-hydroxyisobutyrate dehydrogenase
MPDEIGAKRLAHPLMAAFHAPTPSLEALHCALWATLETAATDRHAGWHTMIVGTATSDAVPDLRTVVLRGCDSPMRRLRFHTDARAPKLDVLRVNPAIALLFYDPALKVQLRLRGRAAIHEQGPLADSAWASTGLMSRRCYLAVEPPGAAAAEPITGLPPGLETRAPGREESEAGRANFAVVTVEAAAADLLYLAAAGHKRAQFSWDKGAPVSARWCAP